jgi:Vacuolar segregation subunit 7
LRTQRKPEISTTTPNIIVQNSTQTSTSSTPLPPQTENQEELDARVGASSGKAPSRGASGAPTLETVQESSAPTTPGDAPTNGIRYEPCLASLDKSGPSDHRYTDNHISAESPFIDGQLEDDHGTTSGTTTPRKGKASASKGDSGSDTGERKVDRQSKDQEEQDPDSTPRAKAVVPRTSLTSLKPKSGVEPTARNMTVETETISSIPQGTLGPPTDRNASGRTEHGGTLRAKASNDTIRPSKGRKKASRKAPSINAASGMSFLNNSVFIRISSAFLYLHRHRRHHSVSKLLMTAVITEFTDFFDF